MSKFSEKSVKELEKTLQEAREQLREIRFEITGTSHRDVKEVRNLKRDIARILTELRERELTNATS